MAERTCSVDDCDRPHYGRGWCANHYARWRRHGSLHDKRAERSDPAVRFWSKVDKDGPVPDPRPDLGPCWLWTDPPNGSGYGSFRIDGRTLGSHVAVVLLGGAEIPPEHEVDHLCRVRLCVRPSHLEVVTAHENNMRSESAAAKNARKTHCKRGHEFTPENTRIVPNGRHCKQCHREAMRRRYHEVKARRAA